MNLLAFMHEMAYCGKVTFSCIYRTNVSSRLWYTIEWIDEAGEQHSISAQEADLCLWRAAETELRARVKRIGK